MGKNARIIIFSLVGLAVLGGVAALLMLTAPQTADKPAEDNEFKEPVSSTQNAKLTLSDRDEQDITSISITNETGSFSITPSGNTDAEGKIIWTIAELSDAPLNSSALSTAAGYAASFDAKELAETISDSAELAKYGLDKPRASFTTTFRDGGTFTLSVGSEVPNTASSVYVTSDGSSVYTAYKSRISNFTGDKFSFVSSEAVPAYDQSAGEEVMSLTVERGDLAAPIVLENIINDEDDSIQVYSYRMTSPYTANVDLSGGPSFIYGIFGLTASSVVSAGKEAPAKIDELVNNSIYCRATIVTNLATYVVTLGKPVYESVTGEDGNTREVFKGWYGITSLHPDVLYFFDSESAAFARVDPAKLISKLFLMPYIYDLRSIDYSDNTGRKLEFGIELIQKATENTDAVNRFTVNGKEWDEQQFKNLYQFLIAAAGEDLYLESAKGELIAEIVYNYIDPADGIGGKDVVSFYESTDDRKIIVALNGQNLFKSRHMYTTQLLKNIESFLSGGEIVLTY